MSLDTPNEQPQDKIARMGAFTGWLAGGATLVMMVAIVREVVGRYFFRAPSDWSLDLSEYLLVALVWVSMLLWRGWRLVWESWELSARSSEAMAWPLFPSQVLVPIGFSLGFVAQGMGVIFVGPRIFFLFGTLAYGKVNSFWRCRFSSSWPRSSLSPARPRTPLPC